MSTIYIREQGQLAPLDIPEYRGDRGEAGATPDLQVGSVTALPNDQQASIAIQGDKENPTINFGIPSGMTGDKGLYVGRPEDAYDETKVVFDDENWVDDTYFKNSTVDYMGGEHKSLKEKSDSNVEYILRKFGTQHYEGSSITATNTYAMQVKSAMFKGVTILGNVATVDTLATCNGATISGETITLDRSRWSSLVQITGSNKVIKKGTKYLCILHDVVGSMEGVQLRVQREDSVDFVSFVNGKAIFTADTPSTVSRWVYVEGSDLPGGGMTSFKWSVIEYQNGMENWDIPYYSDYGMRSVKNPILTTIGKNLWNNKYTQNQLCPINIKADTKTYVSVDDGEKVGNYKLHAFRQDKSEIGSFMYLNSIVGGRKGRVVTYKEDVYYLKITGGKNHYVGIFDDTYEPFKSNILSTPKDLELRGIGDVRDTVDLMTSEYIKRIEIRPYQQDDETNAEVLTDKVNTVYKLAQPITTKIDLNNQKIYSYDGTTHYITSSLQGHPSPILSIDVPTNITSLLKHQQNTINRQMLILSEREEMQNTLIESMLYRYEQSTLLNDTIEVVPDYIQKLYEVAYQRGIRFRKEE